MAKLSELAAKAQRKPYPLDLEDGGPPIEIGHPVIGKWQEALEVNSLYEALAVLGAGEEDLARVKAVLPDQPLGTAGEIFADMRAHFGLGN
jgi:hypothetical protein